jgi:hypothetical protein
MTTTPVLESAKTDPVGAGGLGGELLMLFTDSQEEKPNGADDPDEP